MDQILDNLLGVLIKYSETYRHTVKIGTPPQSDPEQYDHINLRESLLEHLGNLPIMATFLYEYLSKKNDINLGRVLIMLSIHDFAELKTGDVMGYNKTEDQKTHETEVAKQMLSEELYNKYYEDYLFNKSLEAKYANSIDALSPLLINLTNKDSLKDRFKHKNLSVELINSKKAHLFKWDNFVNQLYEIVISRHIAILKEQKP